MSLILNMLILKRNIVRSAGVVCAVLVCFLKLSLYKNKAFKSFIMAAQAPPDFVEPQESQCGSAEISIENPDFELNFEYILILKKSLVRSAGRVCASLICFLKGSIYTSKAFKIFTMASQTLPDHVQPQRSQCVRVEISIENPDFELNFESNIFQKIARYKGGRSLCGSDLFCKMKPINMQSF